MHQHVEPDDIRGAKRGGLGLADGRAGACVHFFDGHVERLHLAQDIEHRKSADAVGDEIWSVLGNDDAFAQPAVANLVERFENVAACLRAGNQLDQFHVAWRVEKVRAGPVLLEIVRAPFGDEVNGQAGRVGCHDGARLADRFDARKKAALDFEILGDGFDDPVHLAAPGEIVFEIARGDEPRRLRREKGCRARFFRGFESRENDAISHRGTLER